LEEQLGSQRIHHKNGKLLAFPRTPPTAIRDTAALTGRTYAAFAPSPSICEPPACRTGGDDPGVTTVGGKI